MRGVAVVVALVAFAPPARAQDDERLALTVIVEGDAAVARAARQVPEALPVDVTLAAPPTGEDAAPRAPAHDPRIAAAREAYVNAEFDRCLELLRDDAPVHAELGQGRRRAAARWLFWRIACRVGLADPSAAEDAARFATFGMDLPADVAAASPEVERALGVALDAAAAAPRVSVALTSTPPARVAVDGRAPGCQTPCTLDLAAGDHVVTWSAPGFEPSWRLVRAAADAPVTTVALAEATPELAARQWAARFVGRGEHDSTASMELLSRAVRARRLALVRVEREGPRARLRAVLSLDGAVAARGERLVDGSLEAGTWELLRDLLVEGGVVERAAPVVESPWFWIGIAAGVVLAGTVTAVLLTDYGTRTTVGF
ncbi:MAG: PEGA domain-containing protein [Sandaracinaceae bacterium]|nr:PEGA domain-containing protein [Sandaracinaceae bacterium]